MKKTSIQFHTQIKQIVIRSCIFFSLLFLNIANISGQWTQIGQDLLGEGIYDQYGIGLSISGDGNTIAAGGHQNSQQGTNRGHVQVFKNIGGTWVQQGSDIEGESNGENTGYSVSL